MSILTPMEQGGTWASPAEGEAFLDAVAAGSSHVSLITLGTAANGSPIRAAHVGSGHPSAVAVAVVAGQHGNEPASREAALRFIRDLSLQVEPNPTVVLPTANPSGFAFWQRTTSAGLDPNRTHVDLSSPEARAVRRLLELCPGALVVDAHEASPVDASGNPVTGFVNYRTHFELASPAYRSWAADVPAWAQAQVGGTSVAEYPDIPHEGTLTNVGAATGRPSILLETLITGDPVDRVNWHLALMHGAASLNPAGVRASSEEWNRQEGFAAHARTFLYPGAWHTSAVGYRVPTTAVPWRVLAAHGITVLECGSDGRDQYVPMDQPARALIPWLFDPRGPRPVAPATLVFPDHEEAVIDLGISSLYAPRLVSVGRRPARRIITRAGITWGT